MPNRESRPNGSGSGNDAMQVERCNLNYRVLAFIHPQGTTSMSRPLEPRSARQSRRKVIA